MNGFAYTDILMWPLAESVACVDTGRFVVSTAIEPAEMLTLDTGPRMGYVQSCSLDITLSNEDRATDQDRQVLRSLFASFQKPKNLAPFLRARLEADDKDDPFVSLVVDVGFSAEEPRALPEITHMYRKAILLAVNKQVINAKQSRPFFSYLNSVERSRSLRPAKSSSLMLQRLAHNDR